MAILAVLMSVVLYPIWVRNALSSRLYLRRPTLCRWVDSTIGVLSIALYLWVNPLPFLLALLTVPHYVVAVCLLCKMLFGVTYQRFYWECALTTMFMSSVVFIIVLVY